MQQIILCSIDSFLAALAIGLCGYEKTRRFGLITAFALCDGIASYAGVGLRGSAARLLSWELNPFLIAVPLAAAAVLVLFYARRRPAILWCLPVLLSFDNLISGLLDASAPTVASPLIDGLASGLFALAGFLVARYAGTVLPRGIALVSALVLIAIPFAPML